MDRSGRTPLFFAVYRSNLEMTKFLIENGAVVNIGDSNCRAPIHAAAQSGNRDLVQLLLDNGAVIDTRAIGAATPLIHTSLFNMVDMAKFLLENGADINIQCNCLGTPLYFAVLNNNIDYLNFLIEKGADLDTPDFLGRTPLYVAVRDGFDEAAGILIGAGVDINYTEKFLNRNFLHIACIEGHKKVVELLVENGLDINKQDSNGYTALDYACKYGHKTTAEFLKIRGVESNKLSRPVTFEKRIIKNINSGEAVVIKLQNGSWGLITKNKFFIFGYSEIGNPPDEKSLINGYVNSEELKEKEVIFMDIGFHREKASFALQGSTPLYSEQNLFEDISFVLNHRYERSYSSLNLKNRYFPKPEEDVIFKGVKIKVIPSYGSNISYFVEVDGFSILWLSSICDNYISTKKDIGAINYVYENFKNIDIMFIGTPDGIGPEKASGIREAYLESEKLNPQAVFFMGKEPLERKILYQLKRRKADTSKIFCSENPGDSFLYKNGKIR